MKRQVTFKQFLFAVFNLLVSLSSIILAYKYKDSSFLIATITFGSTTAPSDIAIYLDAVFSSSLPYYRKKLTDNIGANNAFLSKLMSSDLYESYEGGTDIREPLMYGLAAMDWYDGYDELGSTPIDGITEAVYVAKQAAIPISYSMKEVIQNKQRIFDLVKAKINQSEMGIQEGFAVALLHGQGASATRTSVVGTTGASGISTIHSLIDFTPTTSRSVGNINQSTYTWWRNKTKTSAATTYDGLLQEANNLYDTCSLGSGGPPTMALCDQVTYELLAFAIYQRYRQTTSDQQFNFTNIKLPFGNGKCTLVMDDKTPDVYNDAVPTLTGGVGGTLTNGSLFFINHQFFKLRYIPERNFEMLKDENGKVFAKPLKGDSRLGHIGWMGELTTNKRSKNGVLGKIARTLTLT